MLVGLGGCLGARGERHSFTTPLRHARSFEGNPLSSAFEHEASVTGATPAAVDDDEDEMGRCG